jgi:hypothetical protein
VFHELGHAHQYLHRRDQTSAGDDPALAALHEAEAQVFEAVAWRHIQEFLGTSYFTYPAFAAMREHSGWLIDGKLEGAAGGEEHDLGYVLMWLAALQDPGGLGLAGELRSDGVLSAASARAFYDYLLSIEPADASRWVSERLTGQTAGVEEYRGIALARLVEGLPPADEGHPDLREVAFLAP